MKKTDESMLGIGDGLVSNLALIPKSKPSSDPPAYLSHMKFIVSVDRSAESRNALEYALDLADGLDASLIVVHSVDPKVYEKGGTDPRSSVGDANERLLVEHVEEAERRGERTLEEATARAKDHGLEVETELLFGDPIETVPAFAEEQGVDGLFVGHRGRSGRARELLGSVARGMVEQASVPVTIVR